MKKKNSAKLEGKKTILKLLKKDGNVNNMLYVQTLLEQVTLMAEIRKYEYCKNKSDVQTNVKYKISLLEMDLECHNKKL